MGYPSRRTSAILGVSLEVQAPAAAVWRLLIDTEAWPEWGPSVRAVEAPARYIAPGMQGRVRAQLGLWLPFAITGCDDGSAWSWRVAGIEAAGHRVQTLGPGRCRVSFTVPCWAPLYRPVCSAALRPISRRFEH